MKRYEKRDFPVAQIRRFLEPGPVVLVSSAWKGKTNIMTMGWHTVMEFTPSLVGCIISSANHSFEMIRRSRECVINVPTADLAEAVVRVGNSSGRDLDKFAAFGLTAVPGTRVKAPLVRECYASFESKPVVKGHAATAPRTLHYRGDGVFMLSGPNTSRYRRLFRPEML